ncbi:ABC transporter substrate-binding protein [Clostridium gasigenes]|uniref:ABC transporter substrate-binding protein n=1 Tax=Clostridium gasigenes TaxID=94869 RepID=UPI001C0C8FCE|nr:ABC transporter substrate-binding protein [Clostridium gasigenes]MBU3136819.1 ABC transporter substrate-binding protein [Clostridium gasigenes]
MKFIKFICAIFMIVISLNMTACSNNSEKVTYKDGYPNLRGKHLVVYVASRDEVGRVILELFKEKTGCTYEYMRMPTQEAVARVKAEKEYPKADIFMGGTCDAHDLIKEEKLSEKYTSKNYDSIQSEYKDKQGYWTGFEVEPLSIAVNKDRWNQEFKYKGLEIPKTYEDLLNPLYKGEIVIPDPNTSGTAYTMIASLVQSMGEEKAEKLLRGIKANAGRMTINGYNPAQKVATGEYLIAINFLGDQLLVKNSGFNIETSVPKNGGWNIDAISKIKDGPNGNVGKFFIDFCTSKEVGYTLTNISKGMSTREDIKETEGINFSDLDIYRDYDFSKASNDRDKLMKMWNNLN